MKLSLFLAAFAAVGAVAARTKTKSHTKDPIGYTSSTTKSRTKTRTHTKGPAHTKTRTHTKGHTKTKGGKGGKGDHTKGDRTKTKGGKGDHTKTKGGKGDHTKGDHTKTKGDHTKGDHTKTKGGHKGGDHTKSHHGGEAGGAKTHTRSHHGDDDSTSYTTVTYSDCPSSSIETLITVTEGVTLTHCPDCEAGYTTTYTTVYESLCPTGMVPQTYTVTESCTEPTPTWIPGPGHIPQGFTITTKMCNTGCGETPAPVTVTEPCGCEAHEGTEGPPAPTAPGRSPAMPTPACDGEECGGSGSPAPPYPTTESCPGPMCGAQATGGMTPYSNTSGIVPATGLGVSNISSLTAVYSFVIAVVIASLAFAL